MCTGLTWLNHSVAWCCAGIILRDCSCFEHRLINTCASNVVSISHQYRAVCDCEFYPSTHVAEWKVSSFFLRGNTSWGLHALEMLNRDRLDHLNEWCQWRNWGGIQLGYLLRSDHTVADSRFRKKVNRAMLFIRFSTQVSSCQLGSTGVTTYRMSCWESSAQIEE